MKPRPIKWTMAELTPTNKYFLVGPQQDVQTYRSTTHFILRFAVLPSQVHFPLGNLLVSSRSIRWSQCAQEIYRGKPNVVVYPGSSQGGLPLHGARADLCNHHPARNQLGRAAVPHSSRSGSPGHPDQWPCNRKLKLEVPPTKPWKA